MGLLARRMVRTAAVVGTASAVAGRSARRNSTNNEPAEPSPPAEQDAAVEPVPPAEPAAAEPTGGLSEDSVRQLTQLADLHKQGVLTDEEFAAAKAPLLAP
jgi:hypothetical protein